MTVAKSKMLTETIEIFSEPTWIDGIPCWIYNHKKNKWLKPRKHGYNLKKYGTDKNAIDNGSFYWIAHSHKWYMLETKYIHRLLAMAFIPNPNNLPYINHIDECGSNNSIQNLEWCTQRHNVTHTKGKRVELIKDNFRMVFECSKDAGDWLRENGYTSSKQAHTLVIKAATRYLSSDCITGISTAYGFECNYI